MAEYITKEQATKSLNPKINFRIESDIDFSLYKREMQEFANNILVAQEKEIQSLPIADVVERSKIDKIIEEIETYLLEDSCGGEHEKGVQFALEILKRNIGE